MPVEAMYARAPVIAVASGGPLESLVHYKEHPAGSCSALAPPYSHPRRRFQVSAGGGGVMEEISRSGRGESRSASDGRSSAVCASKFPGGIEDKCGEGKAHEDESGGTGFLCANNPDAFAGMLGARSDRFAVDARTGNLCFSGFCGCFMVIF